MYKTLLHLVSASAHEIVTRKKLSQQYRDAATTVADALRLLLAGQDDLPAVKRLLDQADAKLSRSSDDLDKARAMLDDALTDAPVSAGTGAKPRAVSSKVGGKKTAAKRQTVVKETAGTTQASVKQTAPEKTSTAKSASKKSAAKKTVAKPVSTRKKAAGKKRTARA